MMKYSEFVDYSPETVRQIVQERYGDNFGVGIPFNGTRRWYLEHFQKSVEDIFGSDYVVQSTRRIRQLIQMMFADGVTCVYSPLLGRDLVERGADYMEWANASIPHLVDEEAMVWYQNNQVQVSSYGHLDLLSKTSQDLLHVMAHETHSPHNRHYLRYGIFADQPISLMINYTLELRATLGREPTPTELIESFYGGVQVDVQMWIGSDQPSVFDVPLVVHGATDLYFLQFPTPYLNHQLWRRLLYDILYVRGDEEALYPDNIAEHRLITGLGKRLDNHWLPATE